MPVLLVVSGHRPSQKISGCGQREKKESRRSPVITVTQAVQNHSDDDKNRSSAQEDKFHFGLLYQIAIRINEMDLAQVQFTNSLLDLGQIADYHP